MNSPFRIRSVFLARCPSCHEGSISKGFFSVHQRCQKCKYEFHREPGFFLGAMMMGFLATAMLTIPPMIALKLAEAPLPLLLGFPFMEFAVLGPLLIVYMRVLWLHAEYHFSRRTDS